MTFAQKYFRSSERRNGSGRMTSSLDPTVKDPNGLQPLLVPFPTDEMEAYPVSRMVNEPEHDVEGCMRRMA